QLPQGGSLTLSTKKSACRPQFVPLRAAYASRLSTSACRAVLRQSAATKLTWGFRGLEELALHFFVRKYTMDNKGASKACGSWMNPTRRKSFVQFFTETKSSQDLNLRSSIPRFSSACTISSNWGLPTRCTQTRSTPVSTIYWVCVKWFHKWVAISWLG